MKFWQNRQTVHSVISGLIVCLTVWNCGSSDTKTTSGSSDRTAKPSTASPTAPAKKQIVLFYGNSLTAGYGVEPSQAFPALVGQKIDSAGLNYTVVNAGLSGETTAGGKSRISWVMRQPVAVFVLELGGNDGLRGLPLTATRQNLQAIMDTVRKKSPEATIVLAGMQIPPNMGTTYTKEFRGLFKELADKNKAVLIPFLLEGVGGIPKLNQPDGIHPTPDGHKIVANTVWKALKPVLEKE
ncbi:MULTISPECIES: arylesterase [unclassified Spirosoma]|uniref:arylesterase n=1 Tax=unclassified Spirosoma TaxID=2621999 RepID=UPI000967CF62|nr:MULTISPECIES: arylesterase [unclassified Spirosoma]MBN8823202.1 arylesterase [Spirosoma sp.]OJW72648.1 MAG: arylesterase [Spirosoma sp. 48-14]